MPLNVFQKLQATCPSALSKYNPETGTVKVANGASVTTYGTVRATFSIATEQFTETFIILKTMNQTILGLPFFEKNDISIHPKTRTLKLPNLTIQLTERIHKNGKISSLTTKKNLFLHATKATSIKPNASEIVTCSLSNESFPEGTVAIVEPNPKFEKETGLCVTSAIVKIDEKKEVQLGVLNIMPSIVKISRNASIARVTILTTKQAQYLHPISPELLTQHLNKSFNALVTDFEPKIQIKENELWFPTPENCSNPEQLTGIHKRIYEEISALKAKEKIDPINNLKDQKEFLAQFPWHNSIFNETQKRKVEELVLRYHHIFARHRLDIGANEEFKVTNPRK